MHDPHVQSLTYQLVTDDSVSFVDTEPVEHDALIFHVHLADDTLTVTMQEHFANVETARTAVEPFLRAWELDVALQHGHREIWFEFADAEVIDRNPPPPGASQKLRMHVAEHTHVAEEVSVHLTRHHYPAPPTQFAVSPDVETLWQRYQGYVDGREPLPAMAYFCLTLLEGLAGNRKAIARVYGISGKILDHLGRLSSRHGDAASVRKFPKTGSFTPLKAQEQRWVETAIRAIFRQVGAHAAGASPPQLTLADLPPLP